MSKKSGLQRTGDMARHAQAIKKIIQAALRGGWQAAAMEAVKHYWPYILTAAIVLLMLPIIVFTCLPSMLFGFGDSKTAATASAAREQYDGYGYKAGKQSNETGGLENRTDRKANGEKLVYCISRGRDRKRP